MLYDVTVGAFCDQPLREANEALRVETPVFHSNDFSLRFLEKQGPAGAYCEPTGDRRRTSTKQAAVMSQLRKSSRTASQTSLALRASFV